MRAVRRRRRRFLLAALTAFTLLHFLSSSAVSDGGGERVNSVVKPGGWFGQRTGSDLPDRLMGNKRFVGPGSSPPTCRSKCGKCKPCKPVHVPIQPGISIPLEYYPEAWRCKCGNKLFMP